MRILYDHQVFSLEVMGGMSKYYCELMEGLIAQGHEVVVPVGRTHNVYLRHAKNEKTGKDSSYFNWLSRFKFKGRQNLVYWYNKYMFLMNPDKYLDGVDLVHFTLYDPYMIDILKRKKIPFIFNVYDLNHKTQNLKPGLLDLRMCDYSVEGTQALGDAADAIICISQLTKKELLHYYPTLNANKIQIIYHSIDLKKVASYQLPVTSQVLKTGNSKLETGNYILFIGKRQAGYKNFKPLVRAVAPLLGPDLKLVCLGHMDFDEGERELFHELDIADYVQYIGGDENVKYTLLKDATCFVYPSIAEGFGIPILEARAGGCPVLCSNISVFMEVGAGAALYFDPHNIENMRELIGGVIKNKHILDNLKQSGTERVKLFDKHVELEKTVGLYKKCLTKD